MRKIYIKERFALGFLILMAVVLFFFYQRTELGKEVVIEVDGTVICELPLNEDTVYEVKETGGYNRLVIQNGEIWCEEADCPDKVCVKLGKKSKIGDSVVCLPHRMVVTIH